MWGKSLQEDLARRDFTINAMALTAGMEIIDPFGGQADVKDKLIRAVGDANARFNEDAYKYDAGHQNRSPVGIYDRTSNPTGNSGTSKHYQANIRRENKRRVV